MTDEKKNGFLEFFDSVGKKLNKRVFGENKDDEAEEKIVDSIVEVGKFGLNKVKEHTPPELFEKQVSKHDIMLQARHIYDEISELITPTKTAQLGFLDTYLTIKEFDIDVLNDWIKLANKRATPMEHKIYLRISKVIDRFKSVERVIKRNRDFELDVTISNHITRPLFMARKALRSILLSNGILERKENERK